MTRGYDAFLLTSFGGPEGPDDVMPFLQNVTHGRGIPRERLEDVAQHYLALGGVSPINDQNRALIAALETEFARRAIALPVYWGNRNWAPFLADTMRALERDGRRHVLAFVTSPYSSYSSCRQYREDLAAALISTGLDGRIAVDKIRPYFDHPGFVRPFAQGLAAALTELAAQGIPPGQTRLFFSTHSIPLSMAAASGPGGRRHEHGAYVAQHLAAIRAVIAEVAGRAVPVPEWSLVYQSRSGAPQIPWLAPDINDALRSAADAGARAAVVVPIGFVSDHVEVIWDLDHEARQTAADRGLLMIRVATPGTHPAFIAAIGDLVEERLNNAPAATVSQLGPWPNVCAVDCCVNARAALPTVAGEDSTVGC